MSVALKAVVVALTRSLALELGPHGREGETLTATGGGAFR
jgi:hypothetical protein